MGIDGDSCLSTVKVGDRQDSDSLGKMAIIWNRNDSLGWTQMVQDRG